MIPPLTKWINDIKVKLGFSRTMTAAGADVVDAVNKHSDQIANLGDTIALKTTTTNFGKILLERFGNVVCVTFADGTYSHNHDGYLIDTVTSQAILLPSGYRPDHTVYVYDNSSNTIIQFRNTGEIVTSMSDKTPRFTACFITSSNMPS